MVYREGVTAIRTLANREVGNKAIAGEARVSKSTVRRYVRQRSWRSPGAPRARRLTDAWRDVARAPPTLHNTARGAAFGKD